MGRRGKGKVFKIEEKHRVGYRLEVFRAIANFCTKGKFREKGERKKENGRRKGNRIERKEKGKGYKKS